MSCGAAAPLDHARLDKGARLQANAPMDLHTRYPGLDDLRARARRRIPKFVWEYLDSGTGAEATKARNRSALDRIGFAPSVLHGEITPDLSTTFLGDRFPLPIGISPIGMSGLIWPGAEPILAETAARHGLPYCISTVATQGPEDIAPHLGAHAWYQLYPPRDPEIRTDMLNRARDAGFKALVLTVDVPASSRRERQVRSGLTNPPTITPRILAQIMTCPTWARETAKRGMPRMRGIDKYTGAATKGMNPTAHMGYLLRTAPDWDYVKWLRDAWDGPFFVKGVMRPEDAEKLDRMGTDAIWVSNHAGRQFDGAQAAIEVLPAIRAATSRPILFDSGVETGLDILRAIALGADFVMLGRAWHFALGALGNKGPDHLIDILSKDLAANMGQLGAESLKTLPDPLELT